MEADIATRLRHWFGVSAAREDAPADEHLALAALLVEMMRADFEDQAAERTTIKRLLARRLDLGTEAAEALLRRAEHAADHAVSLFEHTRPLDVALSEEEKFAVIEALWETAFADGELDANEDHLAHRLGDLLHVRHSDLMRIKDAVRRRRPARSR